MDRVRRPLILIVAAAIPLLVSQLLPSNNPDRWSPVAVGLLIGAGVLAGWALPTVRGWIATIGWVVIGSGLILLSWTDLILNVQLSISPIDAWRSEAFLAITAALAIVSGGFVVGALVRRRAAVGTVRRAGLAAIAATALVAVVAAWGIAAVFARTSLVLQPDQALVTIVISDDGIHVSPAVVEDRPYRLIYESRATRRFVIAAVVSLDAADGVARAMTSSEVETFVGGAWETLGPAFHTAVTSRVLDPGQRVDGGEFAVRSTPDGSGGSLWYTAAADALRKWPGETGEAEPAAVPWPILDSEVVPIKSP